MTSLLDQPSHLGLRVLVSDNASSDGTGEEAKRCGDGLDLAMRRTDLLRPSEHFVSAGRWALASEPQAEFFSFLAGDDTWTAGFAEAALDALEQNPTASMVFPAFLWEGDGPNRLLPPIALEQHKARYRQWRALLAADRRELANLAYGVFRREAFEDLIAAWGRGGDAFASDYAAVWSILGHHRAVACPLAVGRRHVRSGADLLERVGIHRASATTPIDLVRLYLRLNFRVNHLIARALARAAPDGSAPSLWQVQVFRAPQWLIGAARQIRSLPPRSESGGG
jgi:Glycosyl transferase family 2